MGTLVWKVSQILYIIKNYSLHIKRKKEIPSFRPHPYYTDIILSIQNCLWGLMKEAELKLDVTRWVLKLTQSVSIQDQKKT